MGTEILGWALDCILSIIPWVLIGYLISIKFKTRRKMIIIISVLLAVASPTVNLLLKYQSAKPLTVSSSTIKTTKTVSEQTKLSKEELQSLFKKVIQGSNGGILDISYVQQGDTIEVDIKIPKDGWDLVDQSTKQSMVSQIGKGIDLAVKESTIYGKGKEVYVAFLSNLDNSEVAHYDHEQATISSQVSSEEKSSIQTSDGMITLGSSEDEVKQIQGVPRAIIGDRWSYGLSSITFTNGKVTGWSQINTPLKVIIPKTNNQVAAFGLGDSKQDVVNVMGTPTAIIGDMFQYGLSSVRFNNDVVTGWSEIDTHLKVK